jgi:hypothetical protein
VKDKKIFMKWWFWVIVVVVLGAIGSLGQSDNSKPASTTSGSREAANNDTDITALPKLNTDDYKGKEGLIVYKELKAKGYKVDAAFENQALTDINGKASDLFDPLDPNMTEDRQSVDAFVVGNLTQDADNLTLTIIKSSS